jgi:protein AIR1/2
VQPPAESIDIDSLAMPPRDANLSKSSRGKVWQAIFAKWCIRLMALNKDQRGLQDDAALLREAWALWLETRASLSSVQRASAAKAAKKTNLDAEQLQEMFSKALETDLEEPWSNSPTEAGQSESMVSEQQSNGQPESSKSTPRGSQETDDWVLPPPPSSSDFGIKQKDDRGWEERFMAWCRSLIPLNKRKIKVGTVRERNLLTDAYLRWVGTIDGLSKAKAAAARRVAVRYAQDNSALLVAAFAATPPGGGPQTTESVVPPQGNSARSPVAAVPDGLDDGLDDMQDDAQDDGLDDTLEDGPGDGSVPLLDGGDAEYREKYFPGVGLSEAFCHMCASRGHDATQCPAMACRFCRDPGHRSFGCPTRLRCTKCKQLGHGKKDCSEKLALPLEEVECAFCQARDHVDASCHELWRSFLFNPDTVRKVRALPVFCYCCGRQGHYGPACGLNPQKTKEGQWETWSQANCDRYQDPASSEVAIVFEASGGPASASERPDLGKSIVPKRHIFFEEADDDDDADEFIRPPVQRNARVGHISFSGNNGGNRGGRRQYNDRNGRPGYTQPPLPPGPPPPLPQSYQENRNGGRRRGGGRY